MVATSAFTQSLQTSIPGNYSKLHIDVYKWPSLCGFYHVSYGSVFSPYYSPAPYQIQVRGYTGFSTSWWADFSVAALCKAMYDLTTRLRPQLNVNKITSDIREYSQQLRSTWKYYAYIFSKENSQFSEAFGSLSKYDIAKYKNNYIQAGLLSPAWIMDKKKQLSQGTWRDPDPAWEMFHHSIKLHLLGATDTEIDDVLNQLVANQLLFPRDVRAINWRNYSRWLDTSAILQSVKSQATKGILDSHKCAFMAICCSYGAPEYQSFGFTGYSQPGHKYLN